MKELKEWLENKGISYKIFAISIDYDQNTVYKWLNGTLTPSLKAALKIEENTDGEVKVQSWKTSD